MDSQFSLVGEFLQNSIYNFHEFQKTGNQHNLFAIIPNATPFQQEQSAKLLILVQEIEHHLDPHLELLTGRGDAFRREAERGVESSASSLALACEFAAALPPSEPRRVFTMT